MGITMDLAMGAMDTAMVATVHTATVVTASMVMGFSVAIMERSGSK